jgi:putative DNA primase/helicase
MPLCDWNGTLWNIQFIFQDGAKKFMKAGRKQGCFHLFGELTPRSPLCVTEGYATGASIHEATGYPVAIT